MLEEKWRNVSLSKNPTTQIPGSQGFLQCSFREDLLRKYKSPPNNLIKTHAEKSHWPLDTHQVTKNKKKECQKSIHFPVQNP